MPGWSGYGWTDGPCSCTGPGRDAAVSRALPAAVPAGALGVWDGSSAIASVTDSRLYQVPALVSGPNRQSGDVRLSAPVAISTASPWR